MFHLLVLTAVLAACAAVEDIKPAASAIPVVIRDDDNQRKFDDRYQESRLRDDSHRQGFDDDNNRQYGDRLLNDDYYQGPIILRTSSPRDSRGRSTDFSRQNRIIADVYSPDYYQPTWILDYRYMKSGGRDYTRGPGGQILILPKNIRTNEPKEFRNFDSLLEHLRLRNLAERNNMRQDMGYGNRDRQDNPYRDYKQGPAKKN